MLGLRSGGRRPVREHMPQMRRSPDRQDGPGTGQGDEARGPPQGAHRGLEVRALHARGPRPQGLHPGGRHPPVPHEGAGSRDRRREHLRQVRGSEPHRVLQGQGDDHRRLPRQGARRQGGRMRVHRQHVRRPRRLRGQGRHEVRRVPALRQGRHGKARAGAVLRRQGPVHRRELRRRPRARQEDG